MIYRLILAIVLVATTSTLVEAQSGSRNPMPAAPQIQPQPQPQFAPLQQQNPLPHFQGVPVQPPPQFAPQFQGQPVPQGQGVAPPQAPFNNQRPLIGSGLIGAQKDGCNCFQLPPMNTTPPYDPYASRNYWDLCPPPYQGCPRPSCSQPKIDFNRFIPRPTGAFFRR